LARAQTEAEEARRRAIEVASLARLGSETLSAGRAEDALARIAEVIRATLMMSECAIVPSVDPVEAHANGGAGQAIKSILIPLSVQDRHVGLLRLENETPVMLDAAQRRFLDAITYYAALAV